MASGSGRVKKEIKDKVTSVRFTETQYKMLRRLADKRRWSISKTVQWIVDMTFSDVALYSKEDLLWLDK